jgi:hypothetical protein
MAVYWTSMSCLLRCLNIFEKRTLTPRNLSRQMEAISESHQTQQFFAVRFQSRFFRPKSDETRFFRLKTDETKFFSTKIGWNAIFSAKIGWNAIFFQPKSDQTQFFRLKIGSNAIFSAKNRMKREPLRRIKFSIHDIEYPICHTTRISTINIRFSTRPTLFRWPWTRHTLTVLTVLMTAWTGSKLVFVAWLI